MDSERAKGFASEEQRFPVSNQDTLGVLTQNNRQANSSHQLFVTDNLVHGPFYAPDEFKSEIDSVYRKKDDQELNLSPLYSGIGSQITTERFKELADVSEQYLEKGNIQETTFDKRQISFQNCSNNPQWSSQRKLRTHGRISDDEDEESDEQDEQEDQFEQVSFQNDMGNSLEIGHPKHQRFTRYNSNQSKQVQENSLVSKHIQREENMEKSLTQGIQSIVGSTGIKNNRSSVFANTTVGRNSLKESRKFSLFSLQQQQQQLQLEQQRSPFDVQKRSDSQSAVKAIGNEVFTKSNGGSESAIRSGLLIPQRSESIQIISQGTKGHRQTMVDQHSSNLKLESWVGGELTQIDKSEKNTQGFNRIWSRSAFLILTLTKKFITTMKELSMKYKFSQMKKTYFDLIDDKANNYSYYQVAGYLKNNPPRLFQKTMSNWVSEFNKNCVYIAKNDDRFFKKALSTIFTINLGVLMPDSFIKIVWDFVILSLLVINVFYIPLKISFDNTIGVTNYLLIFLEDLPSYAFLCDIFMNFNTAYYSKGKLNCKRSKIFKHYIRGSLIWDLLIVGPFLFSSIFNVRFLNIILLFRVSKIYKIVSSIEELLNLRHMQATLMGLVKLVVLIIYIAHIFGCLFYYMHVLQIQLDSSTVTWVVKYKFDQSEWTSLYISSVYWAVITMITLGYGDITPITSVEKIFVIFVTLISCGIFAYAINSIGYVIQDINKRSNEFRYKMSTLTNHMRQRELSNVMQMRVKKYFEYLHQEEQEDNEDGQKILQQCTSQLKNEVLTEMYKKVLKSRKEFRLNFSKEFLTRLAPKMKESRLGPEEVIFQENEFCKRVFFLMRGNIALQRTRSSDGTDQEKQKDINVKILKKGDIFGLESFLSGSETNVAAKALNVVQVVFLKEEDFLQVIQDFNNDKERYAMIKDKLNLMKAVRGLGINCYLCDSFMHQFLNCPYMSYQPNEEKILNNAIKDQIQIRQNFERTRNNSTRPLADIHLIQEQALKTLIQSHMVENPEQLVERIQMLQNEGALQINAVEFIEQYFQDPKEVEDEEDQLKPDEGTAIRSQIDQDPQNCSPQQLKDQDSFNLKGEDISHSSLKLNELKLHEISPNPVTFSSKIKYSRASRLSCSATQNEEGCSEENINLNNQSKELDKRSNSISKKPKIYTEYDNKKGEGMELLWSPDKRKQPSEDYDIKSLKILQGDLGTFILSPSLTGKMKMKTLNNVQKIPLLDDHIANSVIKRQFPKIPSGNMHQSYNDTPLHDRIRLFNNNSFAQTIDQTQQITELHKDFIIILDFEKGQEWNVYLPHNNQSKILEHYSRLLDKRQSLLQKRKRKHHQTSQQKYKQMQQIISSYQIKNSQRNLPSLVKTIRSTRIQTNQGISPRNTTQNQMPDPVSLLLIPSPNHREKHLSGSIISIENNNQEFPCNTISNI